MSAEQPGEVVVTPEEQARAEAEKYRSGYRSGASWFYWIAGLSVVNSVIHVFDAEMSFIVGLGVTQVVDVIAGGVAEGAGGGAGSVARAAGLVIGAVVAAFFVLLGWLGHQRKAWAFVLGMVLYAGDGLIFVLVGDWLSAGFHVFVLVCLGAGLAALRKLAAAEARAAGIAPSATPVAP